MKLNTIDLVSFVYAGGYDNTADPTFKIGETAKNLQEREKQIADKYGNGYYMYACLMLINVTKAQRRQVESDVRATIEKIAPNIGDDHFAVWHGKKCTRDLAYRIYSFVAMVAAIDSCKRNGYEYRFTWVK